MTPEEFEQLVAQEFERAIPEKFRPHIKNVAFLIEDEPSVEVRRREGLGLHETLLGYYHGVPTPARGDWYGMGTTMPDTITLYRLPILEEAHHLFERQKGMTEGDSSLATPERTPADPFVSATRQVIRETIWHEVAHHFGMDEETVRNREDQRDIL
jgi:predicted Zn-dependent protease with MMP-like domain